MRKVFSSAFFLLFSLLVTSCGGGGGGSTGSTSSSSNVSTFAFAVSSAIKNIVSNGYSAMFSVSGTINGSDLTGTGSETSTPGAASTFESQTALDVGDQITYQLQLNGQSASWTDTSHGYFSPTSYAQIGAIDSSGEYAVVTAFNGWPAAAHVGDAGNLGTVIYYADSTKTSIITKVTQTFTIEADTPSTAILVITSVQKDGSNVVTSTGSDRFRLTPSGAITWVSRSFNSSYGGSTANYTLTATSVGPPTTNTVVPAPAPAPVPVPVPVPISVPAPAPTPPVPTPLPVLSQSVAYQADPAHSGQISFSGALNFPTTAAWSVTLAGNVSYPVVASAKVYVTTAGNPGGTGTQLYALDIATGAASWGPVPIPGTYPWSGLAYDNGKIFVVNTDGILRSFDAVTGAVAWSIKLPNQYMFSAPPTAKNGIVYVGGAGSGGTLYAVSESSGSILWSASVWNGDMSSPAVSNEGVFVTYPCQAYDFNPANGTRYWNFSNGCQGGGGKTSVYSNGKLYMRNATIPTSNVVLDVNTGTPTWTFAASTIPAIGNSVGYFLFGTTLKAIDLATQNVLWSFTGDGTLVSAPIILNSVVITASGSGKVFAVDSATGTQVWSRNVGAAVQGPDEQNISKPLTGIGAGAGYLIVPAGNVLSAWYLQ